MSQRFRRVKYKLIMKIPNGIKLLLKEGLLKFMYGSKLRNYLHIYKIKENLTVFKAAIKNWDGFFRSSPPEVFCKKGVLRYMAKFTGKHLCQSLFFSGLRPATLLKKRLWHKYFSVNFTKCLRTPFLQNTSGGCFWFSCSCPAWIKLIFSSFC